MRKGRLRILSVITVMISALFMMWVPVKAEGNEAEIPVVIEGYEQSTIRLEAQDDYSKNTLEYEETLTIDGSGSILFKYRVPCDCTYTVYQIPEVEEDEDGNQIIYDESVYTVHVFIEQKDDGTLNPEVIVYKDRDAKSAEIAFSNTVHQERPDTPTTPDDKPEDKPRGDKEAVNTGDKTQIPLYAGMAIISIGIIILILTNGRMGRHEN